MTRSLFPLVCIVRPPIEVEAEYAKPIECLALGYLATSYRRAGGQVLLVDAQLEGLTIAETRQTILDSSPALVGITFTSQGIQNSVADLTRELRTSGFRGPIVVGGHSASFIPRRVLEILPEVDYVVSGEGEIAFTDLVAALATGKSPANVAGVTFRSSSGIQSTPPRRLRSLSALGWPARDTVSALLRKDGIIAISTSRGCYARCTFCSVPRFFGLEQAREYAVGGWLARPADDVVDEILCLNERHGVRELLIVDDEFFGGSAEGHARALEIADRLSRANSPVRFAISCRAENITPAVVGALRAAGLSHVFMGVESGVDSDLKLFGKNQKVAEAVSAMCIVREAGISYQIGFMMFNHRTTVEDLRKNMAFLEHIGEDKPYNIDTSLEPYFGTPYAEVMRRDDAIIDFGSGRSTKFLSEEVARLRQAASALADTAAEFIRTIAQLTSSITYEWRRQPPHPDLEGLPLIREFERSVNRAFSQAFRNLLYSSGALDDRLKEYAKQLIRERDRLRLSRLLLVMHLRDQHPGIRHWTQADLIGYYLDARQDA